MKEQKSKHTLPEGLAALIAMAKSGNFTPVSGILKKYNLFDRIQSEPTPLTSQVFDAVLTLDTWSQGRKYLSDKHPIAESYDKASRVVLMYVGSMAREKAESMMVEIMLDKSGKMKKIHPISTYQELSKCLSKHGK